MPKGIAKRTYTAEYKQKVVEDMRNNGLGLRETERKYDVVRSTIALWERIYLEEGPQGLSNNRRGGSRYVEGTRVGRSLKLDKKIEGDLIAENQRLRMENAYLKKLNALVLEQEQLKNKKLR